MNQRNADVAEVSDGREVLYKNKKSYLIKQFCVIKHS